MKLSLNNSPAGTIKNMVVVGGGDGPSATAGTEGRLVGAALGMASSQKPCEKEEESRRKSPNQVLSEELLGRG